MANDFFYVIKMNIFNRSKYKKKLKPEKKLLKFSDFCFIFHIPKNTSTFSLFSISKLAVYFF